MPGSDIQVVTAKRQERLSLITRLGYIVSENVETAVLIVSREFLIEPNGFSPKVRLITFHIYGCYRAIYNILSSE
jgi:hypothetical protein